MDEERRAQDIANTTDSLRAVTCIRFVQPERPFNTERTDTMKVKELIEEIQKLDPEKMVVTAGYEGGYDEIDGACEIRLKLNVNTAWYYGKHEQDENGECHAILIGLNADQE